MNKPSKSANFVLVGTGTMFGSMVIAGFALGYFFDAIFDTQPWLMIGMGLLGLVGGFIRVHEMLNRVSSQQEEVLKEQKKQ